MPPTKQVTAPSELPMPPETNHREPPWEEYGRILSWYRPALLKRVIGIWLVSSGLVTLGALLAGLSWVGEGFLTPTGRTTAAVFGAIATFVGPLIAVIKMPRLLSEERYLALFHNGVLFRENEEFDFVVWDDFTDVQWDSASDVVVFVERQGAQRKVPYRFIGIANKELAHKINRLRQRAQMGLKLS